MTTTEVMNSEETLARWQAEEAAVRAHLQTVPGVASPDSFIDPAFPLSWDGRFGM